MRKRNRRTTHLLMYRYKLPTRIHYNILTSMCATGVSGIHLDTLSCDFRELLAGDYGSVIVFCGRQDAVKLLQTICQLIINDMHVKRERFIHFINFIFPVLYVQV